MSTPNIPFFNMKKKNTLNYPNSAAMGFFSKGLNNVFETALVNEPSVFEPLKFYCKCLRIPHKLYAFKRLQIPHKEEIYEKFVRD